jgi:DnaJ family protein A protein 2
MVKDTTLYERLGVTSNASCEDIVKAYKKLAVKMHPDKNPDDPHSNEKFQDLNQAKEFLSNPEKRKMYDEIGMDYVNGTVPQQQNINPEDLFGMFNGGFPGHPFQNMQRQQQKENIIVHQEVSLEEIYNESTISINFQQKHMCNPCKGEGSKDGKTLKCDACNGTGMHTKVVQMGPMIQQIRSPCGKCNSTGKHNDLNNKCNICNGDGYKLKDVKINIPLKNGLSNGQQIQITGQGHHLKDGKTDLIVVIKEKPHNIFTRSGNDLCMEVELKLFQAIYGFDKVITHLDNRKLHISHSDKTEHGTLRRIPSEGMKILNVNNAKGDLVIRFNIVLPTISNNDMSNKLLYLLKALEQDESNNETIVKNSKTNYIKTVLLNATYDPFTNNQNQQQNEQQGPQGPHVGGQPQCVQS